MTASRAIRPAELLERYRQAGKKIATAESCTGGMVAAALTDIAGSSDVFERGFVTYSNEAKTELIGVPADLIRRVGAVSGEVARAMADGALGHSHADMAVSVTGVAGPGGGTPAKPVGLVWFGLAKHGHGTQIEKHQFAGDRAAIRQQAVDTALLLLDRALSV
jgi:nicotinamide-nucleotide amidase